MESDFPFLRFLLLGAILAIVVSCLFGVVLLLLNTFNLGTLVANSTQPAITVIFLLGGVTAMAPVLWAISLAFLTSQ
jgi:hypothetical protein